MAVTIGAVKARHTPRITSRTRGGDGAHFSRVTAVNNMAVASHPSRNSCRHAGVNNLALYRVGRDGHIEACYADLYRP